MIEIGEVDLSKKSFVNDFKALPPDVKEAARDRIASLIDDTKAGKLRFHKLHGFKPGLYSVDVTSGKGKRYKATFELTGSLAVFQRIATHKEIDRRAK